MPQEESNKGDGTGLVGSLPEIVEGLTVLATGMALTSWVLLVLGGVIPTSLAWVLTILTLPVLVVVMLTIVDGRVMHAIRLVRDIAALLFLIGLIQRLGRMGSTPWSDLVSIVAGG